MVTKNLEALTLKESVQFSGLGIHTGHIVTMTFHPAEPGTGVVFQRIDLPGQPIIPARIEYVVDTNRSTTIGVGDARVHTVEHVLAALAACKIDNVRVTLTDKEPPVGNGSSDVFVDMIERAGVVVQSEQIPILQLKEVVAWSEGNMSIAALPSDEMRVSYRLHYPGCESLENQFYSLAVTPENFKKELAPCRTFCQYEEIEALIDNGLIKGGSLANTVVVKDGAAFSKGGLFFPNEMARHKVLDLIGDFSLIGYRFDAHIVAHCTGHAANFEFAKTLRDKLCQN